MNRFLLLAALLFSCLFADGTSAQTAPLSNPKNLPIETHLDLGLFGLLGGPMEYSLGGRKIESFQDFKNLIYPLGDTEASDLIRSAEQADSISWIIYSASLAIGIDVALLYKPVPLFNDDALDRISTGLFVAQIGIGVWNTFATNAEARKFNAVQRYNKILKKKTTAIFELSPEIYASQNKIGLGLKTVF